MNLVQLKYFEREPEVNRNFKVQIADLSQMQNFDQNKFAAIDPNPFAPLPNRA